MRRAQPSDEQLRQFMPLALGYVDRYAWCAVGAAARGNTKNVDRFVRLSRLARRIANEIYALDGAAFENEDRQA